MGPGFFYVGSLPLEVICPHSIKKTQVPLCWSSCNDERLAMKRFEFRVFPTVVTGIQPSAPNIVFCPKEKNIGGLRRYIADMYFFIWSEGKMKPN